MIGTLKELDGVIPLAVVRLCRFDRSLPLVTDLDGRHIAGFLPSSLFVVIGLDREATPAQAREPDLIDADTSNPFFACTWRPELVSLCMSSLIPDDGGSVCWVMGAYPPCDVEKAHSWASRNNADLYGAVDHPYRGMHPILLIRFLPGTKIDSSDLFPSDQDLHGAGGCRIVFYSTEAQENTAILRAFEERAPGGATRLDGTIFESDEMVPQGAHVWLSPAGDEDRGFARVSSSGLSPDETIQHLAASMGLPYLETEADFKEWDQWDWDGALPLDLRGPLYELMQRVTQDFSGGDQIVPTSEIFRV